VDSYLNKHLAFQLRTMRDDKGWSQQETAERARMTQNAISRLENPFYGKATLTTLKRIAATHDVALVVTFVPFSQLVDWVTGTPYVEKGLRPESMHTPAFNQEMTSGAFRYRIPSLEFLNAVCVGTSTEIASRLRSFVALVPSSWYERVYVNASATPTLMPKKPPLTDVMYPRFSSTQIERGDYVPGVFIIPEIAPVHQTA